MVPELRLHRYFNTFNHPKKKLILGVHEYITERYWVPRWIQNKALVLIKLSSRLRKRPLRFAYLTNLPYYLKKGLGIQE